MIFRHERLIEEGEKGKCERNIQEQVRRFALRSCVGLATMHYNQGNGLVTLVEK